MEVFVDWALEKSRSVPRRGWSVLAGRYRFLFELRLKLTELAENSAFDERTFRRRSELDSNSTTGRVAVATGNLGRIGLEALSGVFSVSIESLAGGLEPGEPWRGSEDRSIVTRASGLCIGLQGR